MKDFWKGLSKWYKLGVITVAIFLIGIALLCIAAGCGLIKDYPQDNIVEEMLEDVIENETGINIDLSPFTKEKKR